MNRPRPSPAAALARILGLADRRCPGCRSAGLAPGELLCPDCRESIPLRLGGYCPMCGAMTPLENTPPHLCGQCLNKPKPWERLYFHGPYQGPLRRAVLAFKFYGDLARTRLLADLLIRAMAGAEPPELIVPVPLHRKRLAWRGFNQSLELARGLGRSLATPVAHKALARVRHTIPQTRLDGKARLENLRGAFAARADLVEGKDVLLVDDVATTGATLLECVKTLKKAGCAKIRTAVVAKS